MKLIDDILKLKEREKKLKEKREGLEAKLAKKFEIDLGRSKTQEFGDKKVTLKSPLYYKVDSDKWIDIRSKVPPGLNPIRTKFDLDVAGYKYLEANEPEVFSLISDAITVTEGKLQFKYGV
jgi:hypothetical protein